MILEIVMVILLFPQSITLCPLYDTLGEEAVKFCLNQTELNLLAVHAKGLATYLSYLSEVSVLKYT